MDDMNTTFKRGQPSVIDSVSSDDVCHIAIEALDKHTYWMSVRFRHGENATFYFENLSKKGAGVGLRRVE